MQHSIRPESKDTAGTVESQDRFVGQLTAHQVLIRIESIGISPYDALWRLNPIAAQTQLPQGLGKEIAGIVIAVGNEVTDVSRGDKVATYSCEGDYTDTLSGKYLALPRSALTVYPDVLTAAQASVHYTSLLLAYFAYIDLAKVSSGQTVLITDASQCAGPAFLQLGKALGLNVIAAAKNSVDKQRLLDLGAKIVVLTQEHDLIHRVNKLTGGKGVDAIFDGLGGSQMNLLVDALAPRGSVVLYGLKSGNQTPFPAQEAFQKNIKFFVHCLSNFTGKAELGVEPNHDAVCKALDVINKLTAQGLLTSQVDKVFPLEKALSAQRYMEEFEVIGRVVLRP
ncbi:zinc-dependent alcohol dehydrogenase family protein [Pseudomonas sp. 10B1]|uniref:zinc-dependent alcohol dehydrogenase family protein n=3 Tax=Pseudomonas TaxID=286 RepID=UPI002AB43B9D|nr:MULTISPECIES: zinc-dependent alcohol dehydrogenase family protein [unclassified Pseudomonas]MDY7559456.1 zinc-dependent alcohol dehydrogenase family protein [Pseudomonas sp. AB6]MEA9977256.1 zinc-dependent alcohol dehydrogenase family protein [Pseudomonas sp. RTS4]MEA9995653.1 zinc-dependent alcohol dehydrogenase family protein [Pseudomonas sp. AA4]MEB0127014.1 zinc-dependent alcohol dehydrogenase family protein [Pseudomonas sp. CCC1.2]MEB0154456.1 zinc-dependent alcohol dehydrogenase famil